MSGGAPSGEGAQPTIGTALGGGGSPEPIVRRSVRVVPSWSIIDSVTGFAAGLRTLLGLAGLAALLVSCAPPAQERAAAPEAEAEDAVPAPLATEQDPAAAPTPEPLVIFLGNSLTAGLGVGETESFPEQVRLQLATEAVGVRVINAGVSGDTTAGGLARLDWLLRQGPEILVVCLGANDGLRGLALEETEANLRAIVERAASGGARVLLLGMLLPPNYGSDYTSGFQAIYPRLAEELQVPLVPFLLAGVAGIVELNQADGIHPTAEGHRLMAANVSPHLRAMLQDGERQGD
jgi:acyl-CoA thioesterase-1